MLLFKSCCDCNNLVVNFNKTMCIPFSYGTKQIKWPTFQTSVNNINILANTVEQTKYLGTIIDNNLNFKEHVVYLCKKLNKTYFAILSLKDDMTTESWVTVYYAQ